MNTFQKYWSYVSRITIEKTSSKYNSKLIVAIQDGKYVLNAQNANYSFGSLHCVFQQAFYKVKIKEQDINSILLLGCGTGSVPTIIYNELKLNSTMDAVEIDEKVIDLGKKYFGLDQFKELNIYIEDANNFITNRKTTYDLIVIDLFEGIVVPEAFLKASFFQKVMSHLNQNGTVLFNFVAYNHETKQQANELLSSLQSSFNNNVSVFSVEGINRIFCLRK